MQIRRCDLSHTAELTGAVVVIDVLRSFTTAAMALAQGAREVLAVESPAAALALRAQEPGALAVGALGGGAPAPGFDLGNSPSRLATLGLAGRRVIQCTAGGTRGLFDSPRAHPLLAGSLVCAAATAAWLRQRGERRVTLVNTGRWTDRDGDEDDACADLIEALLRGEDPPRAPFAERVRRSDFGRRFVAGGDPNLPPEDLDCCAAADAFDFALPVLRTPQGLLLRRELPTRR